ncbi:MAG TPA: hypothetical protein PK788_06265 [Gemmatimonadaceae bacterium]|nr:hypothetical protein [Gemmatimonadaceae bacterium]HRQ77584.1 hypothetical protein [Gemmatimonadaceae bacterium]
MTTTGRGDSNAFVTETGWRIKGEAAKALVAERASMPVMPEQAENPVFAMHARVRPLLGAASAVPSLLDLLSRTVADEIPDLAPFSRTRELSRPTTAQEGLRWEVEGDPGAWIGELTWRHPHPFRPGRACTTHAIIVEQGQQVSLALRVGTQSAIDAMQADVEAARLRPRILRQLLETHRVVVDDHAMGAISVADGEVDAMVADLLLSETRRLPVAVLAPLEHGGYAIDPRELAAELCGIAHLRVLESHPCTFRLTDALGDRRLSAYWGALRVYLRGFSCADQPHDHPLLHADRLIDPVERAFLVGRLARAAARELPWPRGIERAAKSAGAARAPGVRHGATDAAATPVLHAATGASPAVAVADAGILARMDESLNAQRRIAEELEQLRTTLAVRSAGSLGIERRLGAIERIVQRLAALVLTEAEPSAPAADDASQVFESIAADRLLDVVRQAGERHGDALILLPEVERSAAASPYEDPERVRDILDAMALVARRRQEGRLGKSLREAFREIGVDYRGGIAASTPQSLRDQYRISDSGGQVFECEEHIALGNSYDPRHCLRIYFTSRAPGETRFVIGHVGRHLEVITST